jgi:hypothetical protein
LPTSKRPNEVKEEIINLTKTINIWLDAQTSELCVEMANGMRLEVPLSPEEFEDRKKQGIRVVK